jgi:hypothetical protein
VICDLRNKAIRQGGLAFGWETEVVTLKVARSDEGDGF